MSIAKRAKGRKRKMSNLQTNLMVLVVLRRCVLESLSPYLPILICVRRAAAAVAHELCHDWHSHPVYIRTSHWSMQSTPQCIQLSQKYLHLISTLSICWFVVFLPELARKIYIYWRRFRCCKIDRTLHFWSNTRFTKWTNDGDDFFSNFQTVSSITHICYSCQLRCIRATCNSRINNYRPAQCNWIGSLLFWSRMITRSCWAHKRHER